MNTRSERIKLVTFFLFNGEVCIVMDVETLRVIEPTSVRNVFGEYEGYELAWNLEPNRRYVIIQMLRKWGHNAFDVWTDLIEIKDGTLTRLRNYEYQSRTVHRAIGRALRKMKLLKTHYSYLISG
jgi:hypothetical protein